MVQAHSIQREKRSPISRAISRSALWLLRNWLLALILVFIFMWTFMPILWAFSMSFKGIQELYGMGSMRFIPRVPSLDNYKWMFEYLPKLPLYFKNSLITTLGAVAVRTFCASLMGYAFARLDFKGRDLIFYSMIVAMFIPRAGGLMARYELMHALHLRNSLLGLVLLFSANLTVPLFIMRQTFLGLPREIEDAALIDGAGRWRLFLEIAMPYAASGMLVVAIAVVSAHMRVVQVWPPEGDQEAAITTPIRITFSREPGAASLESHFRIEPEVAGSWTIWQAALDKED